jgi:hypothetical protein
MLYYSVAIRVLKNISSSIVALVTEKGEQENFWKKNEVRSQWHFSKFTYV